MADAPEVVIVAPDGTEHVFPPGFNPKRAASIVRGQSALAMQRDPAFQQGQLDPFIGAAKGMANTFIGAGQWAAKLPGVKQLTEAVNGPVSDATFSAARQTFATPSNEAQRIGYGVEQTGEFFALPSAVGGPVRRMLGNAATSGGLTAAQGGDARSIALSALTAGAGGVLPVPSPSRADNVARMNKALAASTNENKARSARVAPEMVKRGIWNKDLPTLEKRAAEESAKAGMAVGAEIGAVANKTADVMPLVDQLEQAKSAYVGVALDGRRVVNEAEPVQAIQKLQDTLMEYGDQISMDSLNKVRRGWDEIVQQGKGFTVADLGTKWKTWAAREGRSVLREELGKASPEMDRVMSEYAFWQNIEDVAHATNMRRVGQNGSLLPTIAAGAGAVGADLVLSGGAGTGAKVGAAVLGAKLSANLKRLIDSPGYQMWSAVQKQRLADALASGNADRIGLAVGRGLAALSSPSVRGAAAGMVPAVSH